MKDVQKLRDFIEGEQPAVAEDGSNSDIHATPFDILNESPMMGDGKFKLEIGM